MVLENFNKNLGFGQTPPLVGPKAQVFPKINFDGTPNPCKFDDSGDFCNSYEFYNSGESGKSGKSGDLLNRLTDGG